MHPTHSDFAAFGDKVETKTERQITRIEIQVGEISKALGRLVVTEERQLALSRRVDEHVLQADRDREQLEIRRAGMAERFDGRITAVDARVTAIEHLVQRYLGISAAVTVGIGAAWAVASKFF